VDREIPIIGDSYAVLPEAFATNDEERNDPKAKFSTGFVKITPAHDGNDYDVWQRNKAQFSLDAVNMMSPDGRVSDKHGWSDIGQAGAFVGLSMAKARTAVIEAFKELGLMEDIKPHRHSVKHSERTNAIVEPFLSDQWYVKVTDPRLAESANAALVAEQQTTPASSGDAHFKDGDGTTRFYPARYSKTFESWHSNIRDWCISRQLWWGHRIPVWRGGPAMAGVGMLEQLEKWQQDGRVAYTYDTNSKSVTETLNSSHLNPTVMKNNSDYQFAVDQQPKTCFVCVRDGSDFEVIHALEQSGLEQDPDVLDTWFSSALWPLSTLGWPDSGAFPQTAGLLEAFNPTSVLSTAREIITLWVSRMVMMNRYLLADPAKGIMPGQAQVPFRDVFIHAVVQDGQGRKMSKSLGNGVDPGDIIASHGSDAMRFTLCQMTTQTQDVRMPVQKDSRTGTNTSPKFDLGRNFANKLWNAARFTLSILEKSAPLTPADLARPVAKSELAEVDRWMLSRLAHTVQAVEHSLKNYEFSDYAGAMYDLLWRDFCDWYLESIKPTVAASPAQQAVLAHSLETIVRLLHPIMPFVTEAVFERIAAIRTRPINGITLTASSKAGLLATAGWPQIDPALRDTAAEEHFLYAQSFAGQINQLRASPPHSVPPKRKVTLHAPQDLLTKLGDLVAVVQVMCQIDKATTEPAPSTGPSASVVFDTAEVRISNLADAPADGQAAAAGSTDTAGERARLTKVIEEKTKAASLIETRLGNPGYADKAPAKLVAESKAQLATLISETDLAKAALAAMN